MTVPKNFPRRLRRAALALALPILALALTGCFKFETDFTVADEAVSGTLIIGVHRDAIDFARQFDEEADADTILEDSGPEIEEMPGVTTEPYEDDSFVGTRFVLDQVPLERFNGEFSDDGDPDALRIVHHPDRDVYEVTGTMDLAETAEEGDTAALPPGMAEAMLASLTVKIAITFPGEILETNGEVSGTTVTWRPPLGEVTEMHALASATGGGPLAPGDGDGGVLAGGSTSTSAMVSVLVAVGVLLVLALGVGVWLMRRNGRQPADPAAPGVTAPGALGPHPTSPHPAAPGAPGQGPAGPEAPTLPPPSH